MKRRVGRPMTKYGGEEVRHFGNQMFFHHAVATKKSHAEAGAERLRAKGFNVRIVPIKRQGYKYKWRLYKKPRK